MREVTGKSNKPRQPQVHLGWAKDVKGINRTTTEDARRLWTWPSEVESARHQYTTSSGNEEIPELGTLHPYWQYHLQQAGITKYDPKDEKKRHKNNLEATVLQFMQHRSGLTVFPKFERKSNTSGNLRGFDVDCNAIYGFQKGNAVR